MRDLFSLWGNSSGCDTGVFWGSSRLTLAGHFSQSFMGVFILFSLFWQWSHVSSSFLLGLSTSSTFIRGLQVGCSPDLGREPRDAQSTWASVSSMNALCANWAGESMENRSALSFFWPPAFSKWLYYLTCLLVVYKNCTAFTYSPAVGMVSHVHFGYSDR